MSSNNTDFICSGKLDIKNLLLSELEDWIVEQGEKPFRGRQLFRWLYSRKVHTFEEMTDISKELRKKLDSLADLRPIVNQEVFISEDGTRKLAFELRDGAIIESVIIPNPARNTLCISSQVGCAMNCGFCLTAKLGFVRHLLPSEIVEQVILAQKNFENEGRIGNIVLMGMGEPLHNYDNVLQAMKLMMADQGLNISSRKITLSTSGIIPRIEELGKDIVVNLAVSLNGVTDEIRSRIMPINKKYPLRDLITQLKKFPLPQRRRITFEYVMLKGINDDLASARRLIKILHGIPSKINLIPFNSFEGATYQRPDDERVYAFQQILLKAHINSLIRETRGLDILAACGQLGRKGK